MPTKVLYITGFPKSGSTILGRILGAMSGFFHVGETIHLWRKALPHDVDIPGSNRRPCGCGQYLTRCALWSQVVPFLKEERDRLAYEEGNDGLSYESAIAAWQRDTLKRWKAWPLWESKQSRYQRAYARLLSGMYRRLLSLTGERVIVDSSKSVSLACFLSAEPTFETYLVHLVRNPAAVIASRQNKVRRVNAEGRFDLRRRGLWADALRWNVTNFRARALYSRAPHRNVFVRYEDFVRHPRRTVRLIAQASGEDVDEEVFHSEHEVWLGKNHNVGGNRGVRFDTGLVEINGNPTWRRKMKRFDKRMTRLITLPLSAHMGY